MNDVVDRDLLLLDSDLFTVAAQHAVELISAEDGQTEQATLGSASSDFTAADIDTGHVVTLTKGELIETLEVIERIDAETLAVRTFALSIEAARHTVLTGLGLWDDVDDEDESEGSDDDGTDAADADAPPVSAVLHPQRLRHLIAAQTAVDIWSAAAARQPDDESLAARAADAQLRLRKARMRTMIALDLTGDGRPDATRRWGVVPLVR